MPDNDKGLNRGGTLGQQGDFDEGRPLNERDQEKQKGGISREPNLEKKDQDKKKVQPTHVVD